MDVILRTVGSLLQFLNQEIDVTVFIFLRSVLEGSVKNAFGEAGIEPGMLHPGENTDDCIKEDSDNREKNSDPGEGPPLHVDGMWGWRRWCQ